MGISASRVDDLDDDAVVVYLVLVVVVVAAVSCLIEIMEKESGDQCESCR